MLSSEAEEGLLLSLTASRIRALLAGAWGNLKASWFLSRESTQWEVLIEPLGIFSLYIISRPSRYYSSSLDVEAKY